VSRAHKYHLGTPFLLRASSIAAWGTVSNALDISSCTATSPFFLLAILSASFRMWTSLQHPASLTNPFCRGDDVICALSFWSIIPQYNRLIRDPSASGL
jgi:hypothetical protein